MDILKDFILNYYFLTFIVAWIVATLLKAFFRSKSSKKFDLVEGFQNGGMPSSHTAVTSGLTFALLFRTGFSDLFFISMVFTSIVISDAFILRYNIGLQGDKINELLKKNREKPIHVVYGHSFLQVIAGIFLGLVCALAFYLILF